MSADSEVSVFSVKTSGGSYDVCIGTGVVADGVGTGRYRVVIADARFAARLGDLPLITIEAAEENKTLSTVEGVILGLRDAGTRRGDQVLALGGGVVQDVATLAASLYMRGIAWTYAPTTLMAMADSSIGGKSSINARNIKNLIGNIYPPVQILVDPEFVRTLRPVDLVSGLAEAAKICFCRGVTVFAHYLEVSPQPVVSSADFVPVLDTALRAKRWFVEQDEFDRAERRLLNFGHTFGHALEAGTAFRVPHGVAVALGMLAACDFVDGEAAATPLHDYLLDLIGNVPGLPELVGVVDWACYRSAFTSDKKHALDAYRLVLPVPGSGVALRDLPVESATIDRVETAMHAALSEIVAGS
jgi:3-dehydroquinate synthase